jgi:glycosyltransferase involved in cell wall biosynthesis
LAELLLFTEKFPYQGGEVFLKAEIPHLAQHFEKIWIFPSQVSENQIFNLPDNVKVIAPQWPAETHTRRILSRYFLLILGYFVYEFFFSKHRFKYLTQFKWNFYRLIGLIQEAEAIGVEMKNIYKQDSICYTYWFNEQTSRLLLLKKMGMPNLRVISRVHLYDFEEEFNGRGYLPFRRFEMKNIDKVVPISEYARTYLNQRFALRDKITEVHRLGVPEAPFNLGGSGGTFILVSCSALSWYKRPELLVDVIAALELPVNWIHFGDGPMLEQFMARVQNLPSHIKLDYRGRVSNEEIIQFYRENPVDALLNVSIYEGIPYSMMEAIASGIPIIGCNVCGVPEIVTEQTGLLLPAVPEPKKTAIQITEFLSNKSRNLSFRQGVIAFGKQFYQAESNYSKFIQTELCLE